MNVQSPNRHLFSTQRQQLQCKAHFVAQGIVSLQTSRPLKRQTDYFLRNCSQPQAGPGGAHPAQTPIAMMLLDDSRLPALVRGLAWGLRNDCCLYPASAVSMATPAALELISVSKRYDLT